MVNYEDFISVLLKLQKCYRLQGLLQNDIISRTDLLSSPRASLTLAVSLWIVDKLREGALSFGDLMYIQRRLASFVSEAGEADRHVLRTLLQFLPKYIGVDAATTSKRCGIDVSTLNHIVRVLNIVNDVLSLVESSGGRIREPIKMNRALCLDNEEYLPPLYENSYEYTLLIIRALDSIRNSLRDPILLEVLDILHEKISKESLGASDMASVTLLSLAFSSYSQGLTLCVEPCIYIEAFARKLYNEFISIGVDPSNSDIYSFYQMLVSKNILKKR